MHAALDIPEEDICPHDIERVTVLPDPKFPATNLNQEILVTFFEARERYTAVTLASGVGLTVLMTGRQNWPHGHATECPTAGIRLEIPEDFMDTFRLLARFGTLFGAKEQRGTSNSTIMRLNCT